MMKSSSSIYTPPLYTSEELMESLELYQYIKSCMAPDGALKIANAMANARIKAKGKQKWSD